MARAVTEAEAQFELVEFEQVEAAPGTALLRVAGRPAPEMTAGQLVLVIDDNGTEHRHEQLPALPGPAGLIRAAFSAPLEHVGTGATFSLALPDGQTVRLPAPARRRAALSAVPAHGSATATPPGSDPAHRGAEEPAQASSRLVEAERRAESRRLAIAELERRLQGERERRSAAESDLAHLRTERDEARSERDAALADRDEAVADRDQAEARARAGAANAGSLEAQIRATADAATRSQAAVEAQLADRVSELERIRSAAEVAQARAHASRRDVTALDEQLAHAQAQITVLQQALDQREAEQASTRSAMDDEVASARAETASVRERVTALEEEIASQNELASRADAQHTYDLDTAQSRIDAAHSETDAVRTETEALRHRSAELEATLAELDAALAKRSAEIELLRAALGGADGAGGGGLGADELETRLAEARSEASSVLVAEVELLRAQVQEHRNNFEQAQQALRTAITRAETAEATAAKRGSELEEFGAKVREQITEVQRSRHELVTAAEATQHALELEKARADTAEARNRQLSEAVRLEAEQRVRAEEALADVAGDAH
jgi:chromosome segregation ATPase